MRHESQTQSLCVWPERGWGDEGCQKPERGLAWLLAVERLQGCTIGRGGLLPRDIWGPGTATLPSRSPFLSCSSLPFGDGPCPARPPIV